MGTASAASPDRPANAADLTVAAPLAERIYAGGARGMLVLFAVAKATFKLTARLRQYERDESGMSS